jgi:hypothetical protein
MKLDRMTILGIVGAVLVIAGIFLPWLTCYPPDGYQAAYRSQSGWDNYAVFQHEYYFVKIAMALSVIGVVMIAIKRRFTAAAGLIMGIGNLVIFLDAYRNLDYATYLIGLQRSIDPTAVGIGYIGYGIWVCIIGTLLLIAGGVLAFRETQKVSPVQSATSETQQSPQQPEKGLSPDEGMSGGGNNAPMAQ